MKPRLVIAGFALLTGWHAAAADWPQILGPNRNGVYSGTDLTTAWPKGGPKTLWKVATGAGFSGPAVADGKVIVFDRSGDEERVTALDARSGRYIWKSSYPTGYKDQFGMDPGPRAMPTIVDQTVFTYGADGMLAAWELAGGRRLWSRDCKTDFAAPSGFFGRACSPLVEGELVVVNVGGKGNSCFVAFDVKTGATRWQSFTDEFSYSAPVAATLDGRRCIIGLSRANIVALNADDGSVVMSEAFQPPESASVTAALPIVSGNEVFVSAAYGLGSWLFRVKGSKTETLWRADGRLTLQYASAVRRDGLLFGLHGRHDFPGGTELRCVDWASGTTHWSKPGLSGANVLLAGDSLVVLCETGELIRVEAKRDGYRELGRVQILGSDVRAYPALAGGLFYARDKRQLVCVDLR